MDEESTAGMIIPPGMTSKWTTNLPEEWLPRLESTSQGRKKIHWRNEILPEITSS
jgi:hypothetical protein